jgi:hypothetical protein
VQSIFQQYELSVVGWLLFMLCGLLLGMAKTGLSGAGLIVVPLMAGIFGGRESVGIVLPMLIVADVFAVNYYNRHANWQYVFKLIPWALAGIIAGLLFGKAINDKAFKETIAILVIAGIVLMIWQDLKRNHIRIPDKLWFAALLGIAGGFTSMVGNAAGPIFTLYLLSMRLPKNSFIGTGAWFYFIMNLMKMPFHIFVWGTVHWQSLALNMVSVPAILTGAWTGVVIVKLIPERGYRIFIIVSTIIASLFLFY